MIKPDRCAKFKMGTKCSFILVLVLLLLASGLNSCKKKNNGPNIFPVHSDIEAAFKYQLGSYWIYRDSISGDLDSSFVFAVRQNDTTIDSVYFYETITTSILQRSMNGMINADSAHWDLSLQSELLSIYNSNISGTNLYGPFQYPMFLDSAITFTLNGNVFSKVGIFHFNSGQEEDLYVNSDVGLVKMRIYNSVDSFRVWELQRWHVVK